MTPNAFKLPVAASGTGWDSQSRPKSNTLRAAGLYERGLKKCKPLQLNFIVCSSGESVAGKLSLLQPTASERQLTTRFAAALRTRDRPRIEARYALFEQRTKKIGACGGPASTAPLGAARRGGAFGEVASPRRAGMGRRRSVVGQPRSTRFDPCRKQFSS
jgi:hypothetical protein